MYWHQGYPSVSSGKEEISLDSLHERLIPVAEMIWLYKAFPGKALPYFGPWDYIDFEKKIMIGLHPDGDVGLLPTNRWNMPWRFLTKYEADAIIYKLNGLVNHTTKEDLMNLHNWLQDRAEKEPWSMVT